MKSKINLYTTLLTIFVMSVVLANVVGARVITTGLSLCGIELATSGGAVTYAFTFLCTDIAGELYGKDAARRMVVYGFIGQIFALIMIVLIGFCPAVDATMDGAYKTLFAQNWCFVLGSLCAYYVAQSWDVWVFHRIRDWYIAKRHKKDSSWNYKGQGRWIWNNLSTSTSQIFDTVIYALISFGFGLGWLFDSSKWSLLAGLCIGQYVLKLAIALLDTPVFYLFTRHSKEKYIAEPAA